MADYDAGTARAHIKVDGDSRGADGATRAVEGFQKALEFVASHLGGFVAAMDKIEGELNNVQGDFKNAAQAAEQFDRALDGVSVSNVKASRSTREFSRNMNDLHGKLKFAHDAMADYGIPLIQATRGMREFNRQGGGMKGVIAGISRAGLASAALAAVKSHFIGIGAALRQAPAWQQAIARTAQNIGLFTLAGMKMGKVMGPLTVGFSKLVKGAEGADFAIAGFERILQKTIGTSANFFTTLDKIPTGMFKVVGGMALAQSGMQSLANRFRLLSVAFGQGGGRIGQALRFFLLPGVILSGAAIQAFDKALVAVSNTLAGMWSGIKQLGGGLLAIPGGISMILAAALPLTVIVKTLTSNFKDLIKAVGDNDPEKFAQAMAKIPPYLRPLGQAVANAVGPIKALGDILTATFVSSGLDQQFTNLVNNWLPAVATGADGVANSWKILTNHVLEFLGEAQTISAVNTIFMHTSQTMNAVGTAIKPVLEGIRDLSVVGTTFIRNLAEDYLPGIANKFGQWATNAAASGKAMQWMQASVSAVKNLYTILDQTTKAVWTLLTLFQTKPGDTWLSRVAADTTKLNAAVQKSATSGELKKIADVVKGMGSDKIKELWQMFKDLLPAVKAALDVLSQMGTAFSSIMLPAIKAVIAVITPLVQVLDQLGVGTVIGTILGLSKAFGLLKTVAGPIFDLFKIGFGASLIKTGVQTGLEGLIKTLDKFGTFGSAAADKIAGSFSKIQGVINGLVGAFAVVMIAYSAYEQGTEEINRANKAFADGLQHIKDYTGNLRTAFMADNGIAGNNVFTTMKSSMNTFMTDLNNQAGSALGPMGKITDFLNGGNQQSITDKLVGDTKNSGLDDIVRLIPIIGSYLTMPTGNSPVVNQLQLQAEQAKKAQTAFKDLGITQEQLTQAVSGSDQSFAAFSERIRNSGDNGKEAAAQLQIYRDSFKQIQQDMQNAGPGAVQLANGIQQIAQAGNDASTKLNGLKTALQGLGLLKQDAYEAAFNYAKAVQDLGDAAAHAADPSQGFTNILDAQTGLFNTNSVQARNLYNVLQPVAEAYLRAAAAGGDANQLWQDQQGQLAKVAESFHLTQDQVIKLVQSMGEVPQIVSILVQLQGKDKMAQELADVLLELTTHLNSTAPIQVPIGVDATAVKDKINQILGDPTALSTTGGGNVVIRPGLDQAALNKILAVLTQQYGITLPGGPAAPPGAGAQLPVTPQIPGVPPGVGPTTRTAPPTVGGTILPGFDNPPPMQQPPAGLPQAIPPIPNVVVQPAPQAPGEIARPKQPGDQPPPKIPVPKEPPLPPGMPAPAQPPAPVPAPKPGQTPTPMPPGTYFPPGLLGSGVPVPTAPAPAAPPAPPPISPAPPPVAPPPGPVPAAPAAPAPPAGQAINIPAVGLDQFGKINDAFKQLSETLKQNVQEWTTWKDGVNQALIQAADQTRQSLDRMSAMALDAGKKFSRDFAAGIKDPASLDAISQAAVAAMQAAAGKLPANSPAKEGPLSGKGWSGHAGGKYSTDFATGVLGGQKQVGDAANKVMGKAAGALKAATPYGKFGFTFDEPFKDLKAILQVASTAAEGFQSATDNMFRLAMLAMDPFGAKGKAGQGGLTGQQTAIGNIMNQGAAALAGNAKPSKNDIASAIAGEAQRRGYDRNTAIAVISAAMQESGIDPNITNASGHHGLFQQSSDKPSQADASQQIMWMFGQLDALGGPGAASKNPLDLIATQIEKGGYGGAALGQHATAAAQLYDSVLQSGALSGQGAFALPGMGPLRANPASRASQIPNAPNVEAGVRSVGGIPRLYEGTQVPPWMVQLAKSFNLVASTYGDGGSLHQMGFAADFNSPTGNKADLEKFAQYVSGNLASQTMQLIFQGPGGNQYGIASGKSVPGSYYAGDYPGHTDHVHWATDVAPILAGANANAMPWAAGNMPVQQSTYGTQTPIQVPTGIPGTDQGVKTANVDPSLKTAGTDALDPAMYASQQIGGQAQNPVENQTQQLMGQVETAASAGANVATSVMQTLQAGLDAWGATKYIMDQMVRGVSDTEDLYNLVDQFQKYITFAADVANTAGQILSAAGSMSGGMDMGGAAAAGQAAQMISGLLTAMNSAIDMGQEAYRVFGTYFGQFLGYLVGGPAGLMGDVHLLLNEATGQLQAYSSDNPMLKNQLNAPGYTPNPNANNQLIGNLNYYANPGEDPRTGTRNMMYQVRASQLSTVTAQ